MTTEKAIHSIVFSQTLLTMGSSEAQRAVKSMVQAQKVSDASNLVAAVSDVLPSRFAMRKK